MPTIKFTERSLQAIKPPKAGQIDYWDESTPGFGLRIGRSGRKTFVIMYRLQDIKRTKRRMTLGTFPNTKLVDAREEAKDKLRAAEKGADPAKEKIEARKAESFKEMADEYIERHAKVHKRSWRKDQAILEKHFVPKLGSRKARQIGKRDIIDVLDSLVSSGAPIQANRSLEIVRKLYNWALSRDLVEVNPCHGLGKPSAEKSRERVLNDDEIRALWTGLDGTNMHIRTRLVLRMILSTAQRKGEVAGMTWSEVDEAQAVWTIPSIRSKNGREHVVPLSPLSLDLLRQARKESAGSAFVFPSTRGKGKAPLTGPAIDHALRDNLAGSKSKRIKAKSPLPLSNVTPHDLRRTASTGMRRLGITQFVVSRVLNHIDRSVTGRHYDAYDNLPEKRQALTLWANHIDAIAAGMSPTVVRMRQKNG